MKHRDSKYARELHIHRLKRYALSPDDYAALVAYQGGKCAICGHTATVIDHSHGFGKAVRGLLCLRCNVCLGQIERDHEWGIKALTYLQNPPFKMVKRHAKE
ncbi:MAG: hypothetical protein CV089_02095 [Nitrospira sp. WS110]|nr:hypothetical protein [Nitrospira sp. WS110]